MKSFSFHQPKQTVQQPQTNTQNQQESFDRNIKAIAAKPLTNPSLCSYTDKRKISFETARKCSKKVQFELYDKRYFAIVFKNKLRGF